MNMLYVYITLIEFETLLTIDKKTGTIIDKEVIQKYLITDIPF